MGRASSKKVARAASTGGGRTSRGRLPWAWWGSMSLVVVLGTVGIVFSREQRQDQVNPAGGVPPRVNRDHWHAAYGIFICDRFLPPITDQRDPYGIHTHGDGVIHVHPFVNRAAGRNAKLGVFTDTLSMTLNPTAVEANPGGKVWNNGDECKGKDGEVQLYVNGQRRSGDPAEYQFQDRDLIVLAFVPPGTEVPKTPPTAGNLNQLDDVPNPTTVPGQPPGGAPGGAPGGDPGQPPGGAPGGAPPDTTATTAPPQ